MQSIKVQLKIISPVHIGTGEVYEPTEFFIDPSRKELCVIDFERFCAHFSEQELKAFKALCLKGTLENLVKLYTLVDALARIYLNQGLSDFIVRRIGLCEGFLDHYRRVKQLSGRDLKKEFNRFTIYRTAYSPNDNQPIIPGSSLKGALRTAVLNKRRSKARGRSAQNYCQGRRCDSKRLESEILEYPRNRFQQDPFRLVKISDFRPKGPVKTRIVYAVNRKKDGTRARGPYQMLEVIEPGAVFEGEIAVHEAIPLKKLKNPEKDGIKSPLSWEEIIEAAKAFYGKERDREFEDLSRMGAGVPIFPEKGAPLRLGRHSGAECVTIEGFRHILIRGKGRQNTYQDHATTLWLAAEFSKVHSTSGLKPFGWAAFYEANTNLQDGYPSQRPQPLDISKLGKRFKVVKKK